MAIQLYKAGTSHTVGGIECELQNFSIRELDSKLAEGWVKSPSDIDTQSAVVADIATLETETVTDEPTHPVRVAAKAAGIEGWGKKRIGTLESEMES